MERASCPVAPEHSDVLAIARFPEGSPTSSRHFHYDNWDARSGR